MTSPTPFRAASEVFAIPELLEMILTESHMHDVLVWQRVDKTFNGVVANSRTLQEKLHFRAIFSEGEDPPEAVLNDLLHDHFDRCLWSENVDRRFSMYMAAESSYGGAKHVKLALYVGHWNSSAARCNDLLGPGSWRRMLLSQPPVKLANQNLWPDEKTSKWYGFTALDAIACMEQVEATHFANPTWSRSIMRKSMQF
ncbi:hypothetical protein B0A48_00650 [Cryoendolithus antarcticus]|uniref:F-box domain-containing protein n=1 Tax=Cryoendolithus antarcticus TaxID=1507870 RepID=A0A1V8TVA1_9PEZI|nr:hypothetical protein B0A48_00650 [Cryoendolithus antarcticus]